MTRHTLTLIPTLILFAMIAAKARGGCVEWSAPKYAAVVRQTRVAQTAAVAKREVRWTARLLFAMSVGSPELDFEGTVAVLPDGSYFVATLFDDGTPTDDEIIIYIDGVDDGTSSADNEALNTLEDTELHIGFALNGVLRWNGFIDEARISNTNRSADWVEAQHLSMTDDFVTFGSEELLADGGCFGKSYFLIEFIDEICVDILSRDFGRKEF